MPIQRITLFRVPDEKNVRLIQDAYEKLAETNSKNGKPYIREIKANPSLSGPDRGKGYTFVAMTRFDSLEDVKYYDEECEAHKVLKAFAHDKVQQPWEPPLTVFFED